MTLAIVLSRARLGVDAPAVSVEVHLAAGLPSLNVVGLPETAVKESRDRVRSALVNAHFDFPAGRVTINLAPADLPNEGGRFDLPIALGILAASGQLPIAALAEREFLGELGLSGELRSVPGALPAAIACVGRGHALFVPSANAAEAALARSTAVYGADDLLSLCAMLRGRAELVRAAPPQPGSPPPMPDLADVRGQLQAKRALAVAAAGGHNLLLFGPPGTGKTLLASRLAGLLPPLDEQAWLEMAAVHSASGHVPDHGSGQRPFRAPHHTASAAALVGGGSHPRPGEISLAHHGVLFLDELPEFQRHVLEVLREPLESGEIAIARARQQVRFPARFQLVAAMNPCPCGFHGDGERHCRCTPDQIHRYRSRVSGPLLDRIDLHVPVRRLPPGTLAAAPTSADIDSTTVRGQVAAARLRQLARQGCANAALTGTALERDAAIPLAERRHVEAAVDRLALSARAYFRILKVARTVADLEQAEAVARHHVNEALQYRALDRAPA